MHGVGLQPWLVLRLHRVFFWVERRPTIDGAPVASDFYFGVEHDSLRLLAVSAAPFNVLKFGSPSESGL